MRKYRTDIQCMRRKRCNDYKNMFFNLLQFIFNINNTLYIKVSKVKHAWNR